MICMNWSLNWIIKHGEMEHQLQVRAATIIETVFNLGRVFASMIWNILVFRCKIKLSWSHTDAKKQVKTKTNCLILSTSSAACNNVSKFWKKIVLTGTSDYMNTSTFCVRHSLRIGLSFFKITFQLYNYLTVNCNKKWIKTVKSMKTIKYWC